MAHLDGTWLQIREALIESRREAGYQEWDIADAMRALAPFISDAPYGALPPRSILRGSTMPDAETPYDDDPELSADELSALDVAPTGSYREPASGKQDLEATK
jgi:hypothetical protein